MKLHRISLLAAALLPLCGLATAVAAPRPNIVFFLIDDLGFADCGFNGGKEIQTPNIDKLARALIRSLPPRAVLRCRKVALRLFEFA